MNAADLKITKGYWKGSDGREQPASSIDTDEEAETLTVSFEPAISPGGGQLSLEFTGSMNDKMKGFYRSKFKGPDGQDKYNGVTQFEATGRL